jgi:serine/threonine-protein kinase HipA
VFGPVLSSTSATWESATFRPPARAWLARVPQEDFCQITGLSYDNKYEREGGPGIAQILGILAGSEFPLDDRRHFVLSQLAFWLLAAIDGHAKNFSIFHRRGGRYNLTPLYDVISAWPVIGSGAHKLPLQKAKLAMALRGTTSHYRIKDIHARHFRTLADSLGDDAAWPAMCAMVEQVPTAIDRVEPRLPRDFAGPVWAAATAGLKRQSAAFLKGVRALNSSRT